MNNTQLPLLTSRDIERNIINLKQLVFEVTDQCNLKCKYCGYGEFYGGYDERKSNVLPFKIAQNTIDYVVDLWKKHKQNFYKHTLYIGFYGGEPLMNVPLIKQIQEYIENKYIDLIDPYYNMTTNAMLLDRYMDWIVEKKFIC